jgi:hypothetical protein
MLVFHPGTLKAKTYRFPFSAMPPSSSYGFPYEKRSGSAEGRNWSDRPLRKEMVAGRKVRKSAGERVVVQTVASGTVFVVGVLLVWR